MAEGKVLPYLDIPFQHASPDGAQGDAPAGAPGKDARSHPRAGARSAPISPSARPSSSASPARPTTISSCCSTGWRKPKLDRVGCFKYEPVSGAPANDLGLPPVPDEVKEERWHRFMEAQQASAPQARKRKVGKRQQVIIDEAGPTVAKGRSQWDAPEIDGTVYIASRRPLRVGRYRHGEDRARRRLRPARNGCLIPQGSGFRAQESGSPRNWRSMGSTIAGKDPPSDSVAVDANRPRSRKCGSASASSSSRRRCSSSRAARDSAPVSAVSRADDGRQRLARLHRGGSAGRPAAPGQVQLPRRRLPRTSPPARRPRGNAGVRVWRKAVARASACQHGLPPRPETGRSHGPPPARTNRK